MSLWGQRVTFEVSSASPDDTPVWVDLSRYVRHESGLEITAGRQNNLDQSEPSTLRFALNNADGRFTFGNLSSPYASWWAPGRKCRLRETYGSTVIDLFTGYLQVPEEALPDASANSQFVNVTATDRLGRLAAAPTFVSTLGAHIQGSAGASTGLKSYWPLVGDADGQSAGPVVQAPLQRQPYALNFVPNSTATQIIQFGAGVAPPGEDARPVLWAPASVLDVYGYSLKATLSTPIVLTTGQFLTLVCWFKTSPDAPALAGWDPTEHYVLLEGTTNFDAAALFRDTTSTGGEYKGAITSAAGPWGTNFEGTKPGADVWHTFAGHYQLAAAQELWFDSATTSSSFGGSPPTSITFTRISVGLFGINGSLCHVQVYVDDGTGFTRTEFLAQRDIGLYGLERQTTGDRIRSIAKYAGIPLAEYNDTVDKGTAIMQAASLAGKTPLEAMRGAERTEQGLLYVDGSGRLVFKDRRSLYNV